MTSTRRAIFHPELLGDLGLFYASTVTIQEATEAQDSMGQPIATWANKTGHIDLSCAVSASGGTEVKLPDMTVAISTHRIAIAGTYAAITAKMRAVSGGITYDILSVEHDSQRKTTSLVCQVVT